MINYAAVLIPKLILVQFALAAHDEAHSIVRYLLKPSHRKTLMPPLALPSMCLNSSPHFHNMPMNARCTENYYMNEKMKEGKLTDGNEHNLSLMDAQPTTRGLRPVRPSNRVQAS